MGTGRAQPLDPDQDDGRIELFQLGIVELPPLQHAEAEVLDEDVRLLDHGLDELATPLRGHVDREGLLAPMELDEVRLLVPTLGVLSPVRIPAVPGLDEDHFGAELCKHPAGRGACRPSGQL